MKTKQLLLIITFFFSVNFISAQNDPPIAENDTVTARYNTKIAINVKGHDQDPDGGLIKVDTVLYDGSAEVSYSSSKVYYTGAIGFSGWDSLRYVLRDTDDPVGYDTAWVFVFVFQKAYEMLDINNINAFLGKDADLFYDRANSNPGFEAPAGSGKHTIYAFAPWLIGIYQDTLRSNALKYLQNSLAPYPLAGPIMDIDNYEKYSEKWDRVWKVSRSQIYYHQVHWADENYQPAEVIANWPAHGDPDKGEAEYIAPFVDYNDDGVYNPMDGDYPEILGDQAIFVIYNMIRPIVLLSRDDETVNLPVLLASTSKTEVHGLFYAFDCEIDSAVNNTIFARLRFINRSDNVYTDSYLGLWTDTDIGNATDDYIGCDVMRNSFYGYNGDPVDEGSNGYGEFLPAQSITLLKGVKMDPDEEDNAVGIGPGQSVNGTNFGDGIVDNEYWGMNHFMSFNNDNGPTGDPLTIREYYYYLRSKWRDTTNLTYGGTGYTNDPAAIPAKYMYPADTDPFYFGTGGIEVPEWSEITEGNLPFDRRGVLSTGPFTMLLYDTAEVDIAFVFARDYNGLGIEEPVNIMQQRIDLIREYYQERQTPCGDFAISVKEINKKPEMALFSVYPNPFSDFVTFFNQSHENMEVIIYNLLGKEIMRSNMPPGKSMLNLSGLDDNALIIRAYTSESVQTEKLLRVK